MQSIDLREQTRLLGQMCPALEALRRDAERIKTGEIAKPVREIAPLATNLQTLAARCTQQLHDLSLSQYAVMEDGPENLAELAGACAQVSLAATLCTLAITHRTDILLYEDADPTPDASRSQLAGAVQEMTRASRTYARLAQRLSRRLASAASRTTDQQLIATALLTSAGTTPTGPATSPPAPPGAKTR